MYADLLEKGYACLRRGDPGAALSRFQHAAELEPQLPQAQFGMALAYLEQDSSEEALHTLQAALLIDPHYIPARAYLGIELLKRYDLDGAQRELEQALHDEPTNLLAHIKYAEYYYRLGFYHRSVEQLERALKGPHGANEHVVAQAKQLLTQAKQKSKGLVLREPPDPRQWRRLFARFRPSKKKETHASG